MAEKFNFQVNLEGMIDILSNHLYSEEKVFILEILQNACDAIVARNLVNDDFTPKIEIEIVEKIDDNPPVMIIEDNGIGLTELEVHKFLSTIGLSSKKDEISTKRQDFIGQFGIEILSCFMVTNEIVVVSQSASGGNAVEWHGNVDGSYSIKLLEPKQTSGTRVYLRCKSSKERYFKFTKLKELIKHYGDFLPFPIYLNSDDRRVRVNQCIATWNLNYESLDYECQAILDFGRKEFNHEFRDFIRIESKDGETKGIAYLLPIAINATSESKHKVYLKNMLISDTVVDILPQWAFL